MNREQYIELRQKNAFINILYEYHKENRKCDVVIMPHFITFLNRLKQHSRLNSQMQREDFSVDALIDFVVQRMDAKHRITILFHNQNIISLY